jgi:hypothetical protein
MEYALMSSNAHTVTTPEAGHGPSDREKLIELLAKLLARRWWREIHCSEGQGPERKARRNVRKKA